MVKVYIAFKENTCQSQWLENRIHKFGTQGHLEVSRWTVRAGTLRILPDPSEYMRNSASLMKTCIKNIISLSLSTTPCSSVYLVLRFPSPPKHMYDQLAFSACGTANAFRQLKYLAGRNTSCILKVLIWWFCAWLRLDLSLDLQHIYIRMWCWLCESEKLQIWKYWFDTFAQCNCLVTWYLV